MLIDDNKSITGAFSKYLQIEGNECKVANNGKKGLALIQKEKFDAVLLDLAMPEFTGYDVIDSLVENDKLKNQKIIVLTAAEISEEEEQSLISKGVHKVLKKPLPLDVLSKQLKSSFS